MSRFKRAEKAGSSNQTVQQPEWQPPAEFVAAMAKLTKGQIPTRNPIEERALLISRPPLKRQRRRRQDDPDFNGLSAHNQQIVLILDVLEDSGVLIAKMQKPRLAELVGTTTRTLFRVESYRRQHPR